MGMIVPAPRNIESDNPDRRIRVVYEAGCLADCDDCGREIDGMKETIFACSECPMSLCDQCFDGEDGDPCPVCGKEDEC